MNKTKRKIFETSMKLFAEKGYDATSVEEITATVGVAKGTLYYHFASKEEIFNFLIEEGIKLLQNSIDIKTAKHKNYIDKIKSIVLNKLFKSHSIAPFFTNKATLSKKLYCFSHNLFYSLTYEFCQELEHIPLEAPAQFWLRLP